MSALRISCCCSRASTATRGSISGARRQRHYGSRSSASTSHASPATGLPAERRRAQPRQAASASISRRGHPDPRSEMNLSYAPSLDDLDPTEWGRLAERAGTVFATRVWLRPWWRHYGKARRQLIGVARAGGDLTAIVPLYEWWKEGVPVLRFVGHGPSDQLGPICAPLSEPAAAAGVREALGAVPLRHFVLLAEQVAGDQHFGQLTGARPLYREESPVLTFEHDSWDEFLRQRGRNFRQQVRRFPRKLSELGMVSYRLATDPERLPRDFDTLVRLHRQRWGGAASAFLLAEPFHREFAAEALRRGWLRLWFLEIDGKPVAALHGFRFAGSECAYQAGRDPAFERQPLGFVLL